MRSRGPLLEKREKWGTPSGYGADDKLPGPDVGHPPRLTVKNPGFISIVAMVETVWVLDRAYGLTKRAIAATVERLLQVEVLVIENEQQVFTAMVALKQGRGSFSDALIAELGTRAGCRTTLTFYQKAVRLGGFELA